MNPQRKILAVLAISQVVGGLGVATGVAVGGLLAATMGGVVVSGLAQSSLTVGAALLAPLITRVMRSRGRRPGLVLAYGAGAVGAAVVAVAASLPSHGWAVGLLFAGLLFFGGGSAANLQARYAAVDLAPAARRARQLSLVVWATAVGAVAGPNLAPAADALGTHRGATAGVGAFAFSGLAFLVAAVAVGGLLRPDPLLTARALATVPPPASPAPLPATAPPAVGLRAAAREILAAPTARLGLLAVVVGHVIMVSVMSMTPVHIGEFEASGSEHGDTLRIVGIVLSAHIAGMYVISPVSGFVADRLGRRAVILGGLGLLVTGALVAGGAGHGTPLLAVGLTLLGMGWSGTMVGGSALLTESVRLVNRPSVQGLSDLVMGVSAALVGALAGIVVAWSSYQVLTVLAAVVSIPLLALALRPVAVREPAVAREEVV